ncbi:MAG: Na+/H+ antiporter NhaA [Deltaproteobacteria bacterium]|nr:Na+/H+ antiporter NhaA [Deltaproteobacteria bacterium]
MASMTPSEIPRSVQIIEPFQRFFKKAVGGSYPLFAATLLAFAWANFSPHTYHSLWHTELSISFGDLQITKSLVHWIDEALMALFFFTVGLEIKREILVGELASPKRALLPIAAAIGGMMVPASIYLLFNYGAVSARGWGIPMATDIAFSLAVLAIVGRRIPFGLRIFLSAFAIADDLGAVLVIAIFYTKSIAWNYLLFSTFFFAGLAVANMLWIRWTLVYALLGSGLWFAFLGSGIHATVAGVMVAMFIPARGKYDTITFLEKIKGYLEHFECEPDSCGHTVLLNQKHLNDIRSIEEASHHVQTPLQRLEYNLHPWISMAVLPLFALANAGLVLKGVEIAETVFHPVTLGIALGLILGKPIGIFGFTYFAATIFRTPLTSGVTWSHILGASMLGGIGFTMSLFISGLSFSSAPFLELSKLGILLGSLISAVAGIIVLSLGKKNV